MVAETQLRVMAPADVSAGLRLCRQSRWNQRAADWEQFLRSTPDGVLVAERDGRVIGSVATIRYGRSLAWVAMVLVDPAERGRGVGTALLHRGLEAVADVPTVGLDATSQGQPLYERLGFVVETHFTRMERGAGGPAPGGAQPGSAAASHAVRSAVQSDRDTVVALDLRATGVPRVAMLDWLCSSAPDAAYVCDKPPEGFLLGRRGHACEQIGPVVAIEQACARALVERWLADHPDQRVLIDVADAQPGWRDALERLGFTTQRTFARMYRGVSPPPADASLVYASIGPEFG